MATSFALPENLESVEDYFRARESFVNAERALGYESKVNRSDLEARAQEIVQTLKKWEEYNHHGVRVDGSGCVSTTLPLLQFPFFVFWTVPECIALGPVASD